MRLLPKEIGSECSLDEYNAYQYLLYHMPCWNEQLYLYTDTSTNGKYANYQLIADEEYLQPEKNNNYRIEKPFTNSHPHLQIQIDNINTLLTPENIGYTATLFIKKPTTPEQVTIEYTDETQTTQHITETINPDPTNNQEINDTLQDEAHPQTNIKEDYTPITIEATLENNILKIPLYKDTTESLPANTLISNYIELNLNLYKKPYIDIQNGIANEPDQILVNSVKELNLLIHYAPTDGTQTTIRLDSNNTYNLTKTLTIKEGQNIVLMGGTNTNAILNGTTPHRSIIVESGATLILRNITLTGNDATKCTYTKGKGGAVLVESKTHNKKNTYGTLICRNCTFKDNTATLGGAIYSWHAGLNIQKCTFTNNNATDGGAIYYYSNDIVLEMKDIYTKPGQTITPTVQVKTYTNTNVNNGEIEFYTQWDNKKHTATINNGKATFTTTIPADTKLKTTNILATYPGDSINDPEQCLNTIYIQQKEEYTATIGSIDTPVYRGDWITIYATIKDKNNNITNYPNGIFTFNNKVVNHTRSNDKYQLKIQIPETAPNTIPITFELEENDDYKSNKATYTIDNVINKPQTTTTSTNTGTSTTNLPANITGLLLYKNSVTNQNVTTSMIDNWINNGITDLYITINDWKNNTLLNNTINSAKNKNIRLHAKLNVFYDTSKSVQKWGASKGYIDLNRTETIKKLIDEITKLQIDGICLDYLRYPGTGDKSTGMNWNIPEKTKVDNITNTLKTLTDYIKSKGQYTTSMTVMPDTTYNPPAYGQHYSQLSPLVDYLIPLTYKYQYNQNDTWINNVINYINNQTKNKKIVPAIQTYTDDNHPTTTKITKSNLETTMKILIKQNKSQGIILYYEGAIETYPTPYNTLMEE
ncbi:MAG: hypothetical protein BZ136_07570 [Methanosphaera sp. rholeuAM74]|nr:MAG: hypothetical protein BZ136_07570 [Methanosphaera sp. rholeuAM74]